MNRSRPTASSARVRFRRPGRKERFVRRLFSRANGRALFVLGNQKSGTTAIAALLARMTGLSATLDFYPHLPPAELRGAHSGEEGFRLFVRRFRWELSRDLVKEPDLTFLYEPLARRFPEARFLWVVRDPRDNIRSILNRLDAPGDADDIVLDASVPAAWQLVLDGRWMGLPGGHYVERLAHRWRAAAELALEHGAPDTIVRYEDFTADKEGTLRRVAKELDLPMAQPLGAFVDQQFQSRGDRHVDWLAFFGEDNLRRIERVCADAMQRLGYEAHGGPGA